MRAVYRGGSPASIGVEQDISGAGPTVGRCGLGLQADPVVPTPGCSFGAQQTVVHSCATHPHPNTVASRDFVDWEAAYAGSWERANTYATAHGRQSQESITMRFTRAIRWREDRHASSQAHRGIPIIAVGMLILAMSVLAGCSGGIPQPGDDAPSFELNGADGQPLALTTVRQANEAVVLVFYRGIF